MSTLKVNTITAVDGSAPSIPGFDGGGGSGGSGAGADAWGSVANDGTLNGGLNVTSVTKAGTGLYDVVFTTPMPNANYSVVVSGGANQVRFLFQTATGFTIETRNANGTIVDANTTFTVHATNALPPKGGTGTDAWASVQSDGTLSGSFNVTSVTESATGVFDVVFTTPMPTSNYSVVANSVNRSIGVDAGSQSTTGFTFVVQQTSTGANASIASGYTLDFQVNCTNATLPQTVTQEQIDSAINNPGASAWGSVQSNGAPFQGMNFTSSSSSAGIYEISFTTPMPNADYSVVATSNYQPNLVVTDCTISNKTANGFTVFVNDTNTGSSQFNRFDFVVFATNALPPKGGTGTDAWGSWSDATGDIRASFNIDSIVQTGTGQYTVTFTTPMPIGRYSVTTSSQSRTQLVSVTDKSSTGFRVNTTGVTSSTRENASFDFQVNATNATLPTTFTEAQIQSVIDAQPQGIAKAWGNFNGTETIAYRKSFNVGALTDNGAGDYTVTLSPPMPDANYIVLLTFGETGSINVAKVNPSNITASSFTINTGAYQAGFTNDPTNAEYVYFVVYSD